MIAVTWTVFLLSFLALGVMSLSLTARQVTTSVEDDARDRMLARSALKLFFKEQFLNSEEQAFLVGSVDVAGRKVDLRIEIDSGKINLNRASPSLLSAMFGALGKEENQARQIAEAIVDWRDLGELTNLGGDERELYLANDLSHMPRNGPFESVGELIYVAGLDGPTYACVAPLLTVSSLTGNVDLSYASSRVRAVYLWAFERSWDGQIWADPREVERIGSSVGDLSSLGGQAMTVRVTVPSRLDGHGVSEYIGVVRFKSTANKSYATLSALNRFVAQPVSSDCPEGSGVS